MNAPVDSTAAPSTEISFPDSLLNLAEWLDSQDSAYTFHDALEQKVKLCSSFVSRREWKLTMNYVAEENRYYYPDTTNKERVLAVLMLREMVLSGDI